MTSDEAAAGTLAGLTVDPSGLVSPLILAVDEAVEAQRDLEQRLRGEFGINNTDFRALLMVFRMRRRGQVTHPGDLARGLGITSGAATRIVARLTEAGLLERTQDPTDARAGALALTERASIRLARSTEAVRADLDQVIEGLEGDEEERLLELLSQVRDVFRAHRSPLGT